MSHEPKRESITRFLTRLNPFDRINARQLVPKEQAKPSFQTDPSKTPSVPEDPFLQRIPEMKGNFSVNRRRHSDLDEHMEALLPEFAGRPLICLEVVRHIVLLRRQVDMEKNWGALKLLLEKYQDVLMEDMDSRWLLSICDTYADCGTAIERNGAMIIVASINIMKLADTERLMLRCSDIDTAKIAAQKQPCALYDGLTAYLFRTGDMPANMFARIDKTLLPTPLLHRIWATIFQRLQHSENLFSRIAKHHQRGQFFQRSS